MRSNGRDHLGRFTIGHSGGPGRPPLPKEQKYLATLTGILCEDDWEQICTRAISDAKAGDHRAREWLSKYLLPSSEQIAELHLHQHLNGSEDEGPFSNADPELVFDVLRAVRKLEGSCKADG